MLEKYLHEYIRDPENPETNWNLAMAYLHIDQTASAYSFLQRCAERSGDNLDLAYECLIHIGFIFDRQGNRLEHVRCMYRHAIALLPRRPEAYYMLANFDNWYKNWPQSYHVCRQALELCDFDSPPFRRKCRYPGKWGLIYEKTITCWWWGKLEEYKEGLIDLHDNYLNKMDKVHTDDVVKKYDAIKEKYNLPVKTEETKVFNSVEYSINPIQSGWVVDNFYKDPDAIRAFGLEQDYHIGGIGRGYIGNRTHEQFLFPGLKERFENIMGKKITKWEEYGMNGRFQYCWSGQPQVWHCDSQMWGGMIYLTPDAPYECGTTLYAHKGNRARTYYDEGYDVEWINVEGDPHLDGTRFEPVDVFGNVYNRLVIFDASCIHSSSGYFGTVKENCRFWQMFFFDAE